MRPATATLVAVLSGLLAVAPHPVLAQPSPAGPAASRHFFEYWFGPTAVFSGFDGTITADYATKLDVGDSQGRATQTLTLGAPRHLGVEGGIGLFPSKHVGFQIRLNYVTRELAGASGPYQASLDYTAAQPPDYVPQQYHVQTTTNWQAPTGTSTQLTVSFEGAARWEASSRLSGNVSGGLGYFRAKGLAESVAFTRYWLDGRSALFSSTYAMTLAYGTASEIGFDLGGGIGVRMAGPLEVIMDLRYFHAGAITPDVRVTGFASPSDAPGDLSVGTVSTRMAPIQARFNPSFTRVLVGVRIRS